MNSIAMGSEIATTRPPLKGMNAYQEWMVWTAIADNLQQHVPSATREQAERIATTVLRRSKEQKLAQEKLMKSIFEHWIFDPMAEPEAAR